jgi:hypothetical protein
VYGDVTIRRSIATIASHSDSGGEATRYDQHSSDQSELTSSGRVNVDHLLTLGIEKL